MQILINVPSAEIDLGNLGKLNCYDKTLNYEPFIMSKKSAVLQPKSTVKNLIEQRRGISQSMSTLGKSMQGGTSQQ